MQRSKSLAPTNSTNYAVEGGGILDALRHHVGSIPDNTAYTFLQSDEERSTVTYSELNDRAMRIAGRLLHLAEPGERALMMYPSGLEFIEAFLGCLYAGIVAVPAYPPKKNRNAERILAIAQDCKPRLLLCTREIQENLPEDFSSLAGSSATVTTDTFTEDHSSELPEISAEQMAFLQYTSGSTATPKGVIVTHGNIAANERLIQRCFAFDQSSVMVSWLPMFHDMGLIGGVLAPLFVGFPSILMAPNTFLREPLKWLQAISTYRATCTGSPNFGYDLCIRKITSEQKKTLDLSSLTIAYNGAEPVRAETLQRFSRSFEECGFNEDAFFPCYGMAETTLLVSGGPPLKPTRIISLNTECLEQHKLVDEEVGQQIVSCGQVTPDLDVRIVHPSSSTECGEDEIGEVWVHGPSVAQGYLNLPAETKAAFHANLGGDPRSWLRTGDYGFLRDGQLYITGRLKDLIIIRGRNIYPQDIEACVYECFGLEAPNSVAAVQLPLNEGSGLGVISEATRLMYQQSRDWRGKDEDTHRFEQEQFRSQIRRLKQLVNQRFDVSLSYIAFVKPGKFPRTSSGKVMRSRCQQDFLHGREEYLPLPMASLCPEKEEIS